MVLNLSLCPIYKLNLIIGMYKKKVCIENKHRIYRVQCYLWFQAYTGDLGTYPTQIRITALPGLAPTGHC